MQMRFAWTLNRVEEEELKPINVLVFDLVVASFSNFQDFAGCVCGSCSLVKNLHRNTQGPSKEHLIERSLSGIGSHFA